MNKNKYIIEFMFAVAIFFCLIGFTIGYNIHLLEALVK